MERMNQETRSRLTTIIKALEVLDNYQLEELARKAAADATSANEAAVDALDRVDIISSQLTEDLVAASELARGMEDARKAIRQATEQGERGKRGRVVERRVRKQQDLEAERRGGGGR